MSLSSPFFSPQFAQIAARLNSTVRIGVIEEGSGIVGFFPFERTADGRGRPVGTILSDYHGTIASPHIELDPKRLLNACGVSTWHFDHLPVAQTAFRPFHESVEGSPIIDLSSGYEAYVAARRALGSKALPNAAMKERRLARDHGPVRIELLSRNRSALDSVLAWKSRQYLETGGEDLFQREWFRRTVDMAFDADDPDFSGALSLLYAGDELVAGHFGLRRHGVWHYWFPAYDKTLAYYSPGAILLLRMAEAAAAGGTTMIDLGKGQQPYKRQLMSAEIMIASGQVETRSFVRFGRSLKRAARHTLRDQPLVKTIRAKFGP